MHAQVSSGAINLNFDTSIHLCPYFVLSSSKGSGDACTSEPSLHNSERSTIIPGSNVFLLVYVIRIYQECEGSIEKSVPRITVWHHETCRVMTNGDPEGRIFLSHLHTNNGFFFLLTIVNYSKISFQKDLNTLRCDII